ncbi:GNAT family N-acetyltransferase [Nocardioides daeguensis]|uniref:GNAT family N-acetyltransferase n=1 Tax=Nocardioides daeguensis TaxID=908359 RepID=A0ABP6VGJ2_9ACTN|nr:GNAT family N-acetyltransferase [Nocardioides daeguensis]MBV6728848.1 GNAT family N-acetyltransferase [Nocardioides daeguensis]MCR1773369.1 GNAT family N-acetyltransferase [Nocardioides daeguensis]
MRTSPGITLEPLDVERDLDLLHAWVTHPRSAYWMMQGAGRDDVRAEYAGIVADPHHDAWLGRVDGRPAFLAETYDPAHSPLAGLPEVGEGDLGMHVLVAPPDGPPVSGLTTAVFDAVMAHCFADPAVQRVVVEPDIRNDGIRAKNVAAGFVELREIELPGKTAVLSVCTRADWSSSSRERQRAAYRDALPRLDTSRRSSLATGLLDELHSSTDHLTPELMDRAQRHLVAKALGELAHERLLTPTPATGAGRWRVEAGPSSYAFTARRHRLEHWVVDPASIERTRDGAPAAPDAQELVAELAPTLGIPDQLLPTYLEELASTLAAGAWKLHHRRVPVAELVDAGYQEIESAMTEGHPAFVANNGRIGFSLGDYRAYAPETGQPVRLHWLAARRSLTRLSLSADTTEAELYDGELAPDVRARFASRLAALGLAAQDYLYLPVHPWQWQHKLAITFAPDVARRDLVHLGAGDDDHRPQQSIRTFFNASRPERHYVKTALAIQNMGFVRGLSPAYMAATPAINDWVASVVRADRELQDCGFEVLRELAAIGYTGDAFHRAAGPSAYRKMIAALWRESPVPRTPDGEQLTTMAALLHRDADGDALLTAWIKASPVDAATWARAYLRAYLRPLVHCLHAYDLAFMPHGENLLLRLRDHVPVGAFMKDIGEEVAVMGELPLPTEVERIRGDFPDDVKALAIHTDVFDGVLRFVAAILDEDGVLPAGEFWAIVRATIEEHAADHPELAAAATAYDLLRPEFRHSCLNRLQLRNTLQMVDLTDQAESLIFAGTLVNPAAVQP